MEAVIVPDPARGAMVEMTTDTGVATSAEISAPVQTTATRIAATQTARTAERSSATGGEPGRTSPLAMRGRRHDLSLSNDTMATIAKDRPVPAPATPTGRIKPHGRESWIDDAAASFTVHGDGTVSIVDKKDIDIHWKVPIPTPGWILSAVHDLGNDLAAWKEDPYRDTRAGRWQDLPRHLQATSGSCQLVDDPMCTANDTASKPKLTRSLSGNGFIVPVLGGQSDFSSFLHRKLVGDPFASRKLKLLDATRAERVERGAAHRTEQLDRSAELMAHNLEALWRATDDPVARREALFALWDECSEGDGPAGAAGQRARAMVIGWIGAHLPNGSDGAFSADDIVRLDAQRSSNQHFSPYGPH